MKYMHSAYAGGLAALLFGAVASPAFSSGPTIIVGTTESSYKSILWTSGPPGTPEISLAMNGTYPASATPPHTDSGFGVGSFIVRANNGYTVNVTAPTYTGPLVSDNWQWTLSSGGIFGGGGTNPPILFTFPTSSTATLSAANPSSNTGDTGSITINVSGVTLSDGENPSMSVAGHGNAYAVITIS